MISKQRAALNTIALALPLFFGLAYTLLFTPGFPDNIIIPTAGGGLMNFGFWLFYKSTLGSIPKLSKGIFGKNRNIFLFSSSLHLAAIFILLIYDISWIFELF